MEKPSRDDRQSLFAKGLNYAGLCFSLSHVGCQELEWDGRDAGTGWRDWSPPQLSDPPSVSSAPTAGGSTYPDQQFEL